MYGEHDRGGGVDCEPVQPRWQVQRDPAQECFPLYRASTDNKRWSFCFCPGVSTNSA